MNLFGIPIISHPLATMLVPNRRHKRRRWMSESYHRRIQKKWRKRFGTHEEACAFFMSPRAAGLIEMGQDVIYMHPKGIAILTGSSDIEERK